MSTPREQIEQNRRDYYREAYLDSAPLSARTTDGVDDAIPLPGPADPSNIPERKPHVHDPDDPRD
jgi:hypothetical protein